MIRNAYLYRIRIYASKIPLKACSHYLVKERYAYVKGFAIGHPKENKVNYYTSLRLGPSDLVLFLSFGDLGVEGRGIK